MKHPLDQRVIACYPDKPCTSILRKKKDTRFIQATREIAFNKTGTDCVLGVHVTPQSTEAEGGARGVGAGAAESAAHRARGAAE
jgi:hypothetical protein